MKKRKYKFITSSKIPKQKFFTVNDVFLQRQPHTKCWRCQERFQLGQKVEVRRNLYPSGMFHANPCIQTAKDVEEDFAQSITAEERCLYQGNAQEVSDD